jgi:hypothetical protein
VISETRGGVYTWVWKGHFLNHGKKIKRFPILSANPTCVSSLETSKRIAWLIGPGIFRGNCPCGNFKGRYAGRIGRQDWKSLNFVPVQRSTPFPPTCRIANIVILYYLLLLALLLMVCWFSKFLHVLSFSGSVQFWSAWSAWRQWATLRWANVGFRRRANDPNARRPTSAQRSVAIWEDISQQNHQGQPKLLTTICQPCSTSV